MNAMEAQEKERLNRLRNTAANMGQATGSYLKDAVDTLSSKKKQAAQVLMAIGAAVIVTKLVKAAPKGFISSLLSGAVKAGLASIVATKLAPKKFHLN